MIRLAVSGADQRLREELAPRLRGAVLEACVDLSEAPDSLRGADAVICLGTVPADTAAIERILLAGKHVLLSTQAGPASATLQALSGTARKARVQFALANLDRYLPSRQLIRQHLDAAKLGEPGLIRVYRWESLTNNVPGTEGLPGSLWRDLDVVLWYFDLQPNIVFSVQQQSRDSQACASLQIHLGFPGGGMALLCHTGNLPAGPGYLDLSVIGSAGAAYADDHQNMQLVYRGGTPQAVGSSEGVLPVVAAVQAFVNALNARGEGPWQCVDWEKVFAVARAVQQSLRLGQAVVLEESR